MIKLTALWQKESQAGEIYYQGNLGAAKILMYPSKSENPNAPAFNIFLAEGQTQRTGQAKPQSQPRTAKEEDDDVPF